MSEKEKTMYRDQYLSDKNRLSKEAKSFRLPGELLPQVFKFLFFIGLAFLNCRLFAEVVPGWWGRSTGVVAVMAEAIAFYSAHYFSRSSGKFRWALGLSGSFLMAFSIIHGTVSILDLNGAANLYAGAYENINFYSHVVAFPLLAGLLGLSVIAITMTHPINRIRFKQAVEHTRIAISRAEAASRLELMRSQSVVHRAWLDQQREDNERQQEYLVELQKLIAIEERKTQIIASISDPALRRKIAHGFSPNFQSQKPLTMPSINDTEEQDWRQADGLWERQSNW